MNNKKFIKNENIDYILNFYRLKLYNNINNINNIKTYIITVDSGQFLFLNSSALYQLKRGKIEDEKLFNILVEKSIIINNDNFIKTIQKTKIRYYFLDSAVSLHIVIPTRRCNQGCKYCFATPDKINADINECDMGEKTALKTIDFIMNSKSNLITIEFTGGEALIRFDLIKIMVNYANKLNLKLKKDLKFSVVTNLTLMNYEIANWLIDNNVSICTSLDGPKNVHNKNRYILGLNGKKNIGSYDMVINWIEKINNLYKEKNLENKVTALLTITANSLKYYKEIIDLYVKYEMPIIDLRGMMSIGNANEDYNTNKIVYSFKEFVEFYQKSIKYIDQLKAKGIQIDDRMRDLYKTKILENIPTFHTDYESPWGSGIGTLTYYNDGSIYCCHEALGRDEFKLGTIYEKHNDIYKKEETSFTILSSMLESNPICDRCIYKPYCSTLPIENFYSQNKFNFNPYKTQRHYETIFHSNKILEKEFKKLKFSAVN